MTILLNFIFVIMLICLGNRFERKWALSRFYISPPLLAGSIGSILLVGLSWIFGVRWSFEPMAGRLLVTGFLFFIGFKMGMVYTRRHMRSLLLFFLLSSGLLFLLEFISWALFRGDSTWMVSLGAMSFAWNDEWMSYVSMYDSDSSTAFHTSLLLIFLITPLVIRLLSNKVMGKKETIVHPSITFKWHAIGILIVVTAAVSAYWLKHLWLMEVPFLFDFVLSMGMGIGTGLLFRRKQAQNPLVQSIGLIGKWALHGFIIFMMLVSSYEVWLYGKWSIIGLVVLKISILTPLLVILSHRVVRNRQYLIWVSATWAYSFSAPVTCMNAMRSVADKHGESDEVILIVPPVILWLINYPHYWIFMIFYGKF